MIIVDENNIVIQDPDLELGELYEQAICITHTWVVDTPEETHDEIVKRYPNGGVVVATVVDAEEVGHWETLDDSGYDVNYEFDLEGRQSESPIVDEFKYYIYHEYTQEELDSIAEQEANNERIAMERQEQKMLLSTLSSRLDEYDEAICTLYELTLGV